MRIMHDWCQATSQKEQPEMNQKRPGGSMHATGFFLDSS